MLQCLEHCAAVRHSWSDSGVGWDVNSEHVSSSAIPMSLPLPQGEHKVEQVCFHGRIRHLTVQKSPMSSLTGTLSLHSCLWQCVCPSPPPMLCLRHRARCFCPILPLCWCDFLASNTWLHHSKFAAERKNSVIYLLTRPLAIFYEKLKISLTSELVDAFQVVVANPGTVAMQKEAKRQHSIRRKKKFQEFYESKY